MTTPSFGRFLTVTASTKRNMSGDEAVEHLASLEIMPLMPVSPETAQVLPLNSPREANETLCADADVAEGDWLVVGSTTYAIRSVAEWPGLGDFLHLVVEELK